MTAEATNDAFLGGRLRLTQPARGHRLGTDAILLAAGARPLPGQTVVDLGSGVGGAGLAIAARFPESSVVLVDIDAGIAALAAGNIAANGLADRVRVVNVDLTASQTRRTAAGLAPLGADIVVMNPPFHLPGTTRASPITLRQSAHIGERDTDEAWSRTAASLLRRDGVLVAIHRADALPRMLAALSGRFGDIRVLPVQAGAASPALRVLLRAVKASRAPLTLLPALVLHDEAGAFTPPVEQLHRGEAGIDWQMDKK